MKYKLLLIIFCLLCNVAAQARITDVNISKDIQLVGLLGSKLKIEMILNNGDYDPIHLTKSKECQDLEGNYYYRTQLLPIHLRGRYCPANKSFFLVANNGTNDTERFEGSYDAYTQKFTGTWTLLKTAKTLPFSLVSYHRSMRASAMKGFYKVFEAHMTTDRGPEEATISNCGWTPGVWGEIWTFKVNWLGDIETFAPARVQYWTSVSNQNRSTNTWQIFQLLPSTSGTYVAHLYNYRNYFKTSADDLDEEEGKLSCMSELRVYQLVGDVVTDVTAQCMPTRIPPLYSFDHDPYDVCYAELTSDGVLLPAEQRLYWDGKKYVLE